MRATPCEDRIPCVVGAAAAASASSAATAAAALCFLHRCDRPLFLRCCLQEENSEAAPGNERGSSAGWLPRGVPRWMGVATLNDSRLGVVDVKFAPGHLEELKLASASEDG